MPPIPPSDEPRRAVRAPAAVFHPPGVIRLITPAEAAARQQRAPEATHHHTPDEGAATTAAAPGEEA